MGVNLQGKKRGGFSFRVEVNCLESGSVASCYIHLADRKVAKTREVRKGILLADYDRKGRLVGLEILGPIKLSIVIKQLDHIMRQPFRKALRESFPASLRVA